MADPARSTLALPVRPEDHVFGAHHARVTLVEYGDFECPGCGQAAPGVRKLVERLSDRVRLVFRHYPLEDAHPHALHAAMAAEAAGAQGKFWPMHDLLFQNQRHLKDPQLRSYAQQLELDLERYDLEMADTVYLQRVREHIESGRKSSVRSTPTFFVNGVVQDVSFGLEALVAKVESLAGRHAG